MGSPVSQFARRCLGKAFRSKRCMCGVISEQQPNPQSRISLGSRRDQLGIREVVVDWRLVAEDKSKAAAIVRLLGAEVGRTGFGRLRSSFGEDDAWPKDFVGNEHHMGTTRMHRDPALGVVDENCRMHAVANLYIAGSSVFPTSGRRESYANHCCPGVAPRRSSSRSSLP